jgi:hypothetical protein
MLDVAQVLGRRAGDVARAPDPFECPATRVGEDRLERHLGGALREEHLRRPATATPGGPDPLLDLRPSGSRNFA